MITGKNYIGNQLSATGNKTFKTINPLLNIENQWEITEASNTEVNQAAELASIAYKTYSKISGAKKAEFLRAIADEIENAVSKVLDKNLRTADIYSEGCSKLTTQEMGQAIIHELH